MKKILLKVKIFLFTLAVVAVGCDKQVDNTEAENTIGCGKINISKNEFVSWCVVPYEVSENSENKEILKNRTKKTLTFGLPFSLEYFSDGEWIPIQPFGMPWLDIPFHLLAGKTTEGSSFNQTSPYRLVERFNESKKGKYRISRRFSVYSSDIDPVTGMKRFEFSFNLYAEFLIE